MAAKLTALPTDLGCIGLVTSLDEIVQDLLGGGDPGSAANPLI
jgi:hypothetical protein